MPDQISRPISLGQRTPNKLTTTNDTNEIRAALSGGAFTPSFRLDGRLVALRPAFLGVVTETGPDGDEDNYSDERYWIRRSSIDGTDATTDDQEAADTTTPLTTSYWDRPPKNRDPDETGPQPFVVTATNLCEGSLDKEESGIPQYEGGTHLLDFGTRVVVWALLDAANPPNVRYFFNHPVSRVVRVKITSAATGAGKYNGRIVYPSQDDFSPYTDLTAGELGDTADADDCWVVNLAEVGQSGHALTDDGNNTAFFIGIVRGRSRGKKSYQDGDGNEVDPDMLVGGETEVADRHVVEIWGTDYDGCNV